MRLRKKRLFKTLVLTRGLISGAVSAVLGIGAFLILCAAVIILAEHSDFSAAVINRYFGKNTVYAEVAEVFTDPKGRVSAIIGGYTQLIPELNPPTEAPVQTPVSTEAPQPVITETTAKSLSEVKNQSGKSFDADLLVSQPLAYSIENGSPQVLIVHTHTTESYYEQDRSVDDSKNMTVIGKVIADKLTAGGIEVIHDTTVHDYPSYNGAYTRAAATTKARLAENPGIKIVLDVHRDAVASDDGSKLKLVADINGEKAAQVMFVVGTDAQLTHDCWQENFKLALKLQRKANELYPNLMRPINLREQRFNQQLSTGSIIIEVGTNGNTFDEAKKGAELIGDVIAKVLSEA